MIENNTASGAPTNVISSEQSAIVFFGPHSTSQVSQTFTIDQFPFDISAFNLIAGDVITVNQTFGAGSGSESAPFAPVNGAVTLTPNRTKVRITYPGRYQLVHSGPGALGTFVVIGAAIVAEENNLADAFSALINTLVGISVVGVDPIKVTATNPYTVSIDTVATATVTPSVIGGALAETVNLSAVAGNLLQVNTDGLYYGIQPPPNFANQYVSSSTGNDANAGTIGSPLKTIQKAISNLPDSTSGNIFLYAGDTFHTYATAVGDVISGVFTFIQALGQGINIGNRVINFYPYNDAAITAINNYNIANNTGFDPYVAAEINFPIIQVTLILPTDSPTYVAVGISVGNLGTIAFHGVNVTVGQTGTVSPAYISGFLSGGGDVVFEGGRLVLGSVPVMFSSGGGLQKVSTAYLTISDHGVASTPPIFCAIGGLQYIYATLAPLGAGIPLVLTYHYNQDNVETYLATAALWPGIVIYSTANRAFKKVITSIAIA